MIRVVVLLGAWATGWSATAADSIVLGRGVSSAFLSRQPCPQGAICMDANYIWILDADQTISGPAVTGRVRAVTSQHTDATATFVRSVQLFVLRPIKNPALRRSSRADYFIVSLSPRDERGRYCLSVNPTDVGLKLDPSKVEVEASSGYFCFNATALESNNRSSGP